MRRALMAACAVMVSLAVRTPRLEARPICNTYQGCEQFCPTDLDSYCEIHIPQYCILVEDSCAGINTCRIEQDDLSTILVTCHTENNI
jgi:hypothetical protein